MSAIYDTFENIKDIALQRKASKYRGLFGGAGVVVRQKGKEREEWPGHIFVESEHARAISRFFFALRDELRAYIDLDVREVIYFECAEAANEAIADDASLRDIIDAMISRAEIVLRKMKRFYFAYGSNMDEEQMLYRCPDAELIGAARINGWELCMDASGYATIRHSEGFVEGALWAISIADEVSLDRYEGVASGCYEKCKIRVSDRHVSALVYVSRRMPTSMDTWRSDYMARLTKAADELGLSDAAKARIQSIAVA